MSKRRGRSGARWSRLERVAEVEADEADRGRGMSFTGGVAGRGHGLSRDEDVPHSAERASETGGSRARSAAAQSRRLDGR